MAWKLSQEGINKFEELKKEHPDYAETIDAILRLDREGNLESAMIMLNLIKIINEGLGR